jgi:hypothetical protein
MRSARKLRSSPMGAGGGGAVPVVVPDLGAVGEPPLNRLLASPEWSSTPGKVAFLWCLADFAFFVVLWAIGDRGAAGVLIEVGVWVPFTLLLGRLLTRPLSGVTYLGAVVVLALAEETLAYSTGGGLHGAATSLAEDWVRSVPTFVGIAVGILLAIRWVGLSAPESFATAALVGVVIEIGLGTGFNFVALLGLSGAVGWIYGTIVALPTTHSNAPQPVWVRWPVTSVLVAAWTLTGGFVGLGLQAALHL